jgi:CpeT protein
MSFIQQNKMSRAIIFSVLFLAACSSVKKSTVTKTDNELNQLEQLLSGSFSSELQSKEDTSYFNISLVMLPIWTNRTDGKWMYVEQAMATKLDKPYRQRVYHLQHSGKNTFTSDIYTIKNALTYAGLQNDKSKLEKLSFDSLELKDGCTVTLKNINGVFSGGTDGRSCPSDLRGAKYATTKITLKKGELISWDQGFDANDKQVWGATKGGYIFIKK